MESLHLNLSKTEDTTTNLEMKLWPLWPKQKFIRTTKAFLDFNSHHSCTALCTMYPCIRQTHLIHSTHPVLCYGITAHSNPIRPKLKSKRKKGNFEYLRLERMGCECGVILLLLSTVFDIY